MPTTKMKCARCGAERDAEDIKMGTIFYIGFERGKKRSLKKVQPYCDDKPCHAHDQMAHEG